MSNNWLTYVWKNSPYKGAKRLVHLALADSANAETGECWPRQTVISEKTLVARQRVNEAIKQMIEDGYLTKSRSGEHGSGNTYWLQKPDQPSGEETTGAGENVPIPDVERPESGQSNVPIPDVERPHTGHANRALTEPSGEPSVESTTSGTRSRMMIRPDGWEEPPGDVPPVPHPNSPAARAQTRVTHATVVTKFTAEMERHDLGTDFNKGLLHSVIKSLRDDGYSNEEIAVLVEFYFARGHWDIRAKRGTLDPAVMFRQVLPQVMVRAEPTIRRMRSGKPDPSKAIRDDLMRRLKESPEASRR